MSESYDNPIALINIKWKSIYDVLCKGGDTVFEQSANLFTLCATIGHLLNQPKDFEKKHQLFRWTSLNQQTEVSILAAIAWDDRGQDLSILSDRREIINISMKYAEGGMCYLYDTFFVDHCLNDYELQTPDKLNIEYNLAQIIEGLRRSKNIVNDL